MKDRSSKIPSTTIQQAIMKAAIASAKIEGVSIAEKNATKVLEKVILELKQAERKG